MFEGEALYKVILLFNGMEGWAFGNIAKLFKENPIFIGYEEGEDKV